MVEFRVQKWRAITSSLHALKARRFINMVCRRCRSNNVTIQMEQVGGRTAKHGPGLGGNINNTARALTAIGTLGMSNLFWKKSKGTEKTKVKNEKICICQDCGYSWKIK